MTNGMRPKRSLLAALLTGSLLLPPAAIARADEKAPEGPPSRAEFTKLQNDVREQRQLIIQMMQTEQQRYDLLLHLLQGQGGGTPLPGLSAAPAPAPASPSAEAIAEKPASHAGGGESAHRPTSIEGKVSIDGGSSDEVYVYVENVKMPVKNHKTFEIRQEGRQFHPRVAVVQTGTNLVFPNMDAVYHNVFSNSPRNTFDLGTYQAGDKARSVVVTGPGIVDIYCNLHQKMSAKVLVVPSVLYAKVHADGTFRIDNVPPGVRRVVAWSPDAKPETQRVAVEGPTQVSFTLHHQESSAHSNKFGQAYGSYRD